MPEIHTESDDKRRKRVRECWGDREVRKGYYCATCDSGMPTPSSPAWSERGGACVFYPPRLNPVSRHLPCADNPVYLAHSHGCVRGGVYVNCTSGVTIIIQYSTLQQLKFGTEVCERRRGSSSMAAPAVG